MRARSDVVPVILERNVGFAIFFLNNDTLVPPGTIDRLAATLEDSGAAAVGPKLLHADATLQVAGLAMLAGRRHFERLYAYLDADLAQAQIAYEPAALSGKLVDGSANDRLLQARCDDERTPADRENEWNRGRCSPRSRGSNR